MRLAISVLLGGLVAAACGSDDAGSSGDSSGTTAETGSSGPTTSSSGPTTSETSTGTDASTGSSTSGTDATTSTGADSSSTGDSGSSSGGSSDSTTGSGEALVVINELSSNNDGGIGADPIEFYNAGDAPIDLSGWIVTDDLATPADPYDPLLDDEEYVFPDGTTLAPGAYVVVVRGPLPDGHPFGLSGDGDAVALINPALDVIDFVAYALGEAAISYCRIPDGPDGEWVAACAESFGETNG